MSLSDKKCVPCQGGEPPLEKEKAKELLTELSDGWELQNLGKKLVKKFKFTDFKSALDFINKVGDIAEEEDHHPDIYLHNYKYVTLYLFTHKIAGLHENDFILAAKVDNLNSRE